MRINNNIVAMRTNQNLRATNNALDKSINRLSSGIRLTEPKDDPASFAIVKRLTAQTRGLAQGSENSGGGISAIQTAEGALTEIQAMLQRINELSVQAANDTNDPKDRATIQDEVTQLKEEIDRIANTTDYNGRILLDGSTERTNYITNTSGKFAASTQMLSISSTVSPGDYQFKVTTDPAKAQATFNTISVGSFSINGEEIQISAEDIPNNAYVKIQELCERNNMTYERTGTNITVTTKEYGKDALVDIKNNNTVLAHAVGTDAVVAPITTVGGFDANVEVNVKGNIATFTNKDGFEIKVQTAAGSVADDKMTATVVDAGTMAIQTGCNEGDELELIFSKVSSYTLEIDNINVRSGAGAQNAIEMASSAITKISKLRAQMGAYQNRLDYASGSVDEENENITDALSRINDTDMAAEMTEYTQKNVLAQATSTILAKANQRPETVLQLLQS